MDEVLNLSLDSFARTAMQSIPFSPGQRVLNAPYVETEDKRKLFVVDAQQSADIENGDLAVYRSVSGCTILELEFEDRVEVYHISAGTFSVIDGSSFDEPTGYEKFFIRKVAALGQKKDVKKIRYYINQVHTGREEDRRSRIFKLNATALKDISDNCEIFEVRKEDGSQTDDLFESVDILSNGKEARILQPGYKIERL